MSGIPPEWMGPRGSTPHGGLYPPPWWVCSLMDVGPPSPHLGQHVPGLLCRKAHPELVSEGKPRTPLSSRVATRVSWSPLSGLKGMEVKKQQLELDMEQKTGSK